MKKKVIPTRFMEIEEERSLEGQSKEKKQQGDFIGNQSPSPEAPPKSRKR